MQITTHPEPTVARVRLLPRGSWLAAILIFLFVMIEAAFASFVPRRDLISLPAAAVMALAITLVAGLLRDFLFASLRSHSLAELRTNMFHRLRESGKLAAAGAR
jgi:hypothetical protein